MGKQLIQTHAAFTWFNGWIFAVASHPVLATMETKCGSSHVTSASRHGPTNASLNSPWIKHEVRIPSRFITKRTCRFIHLVHLPFYLGQHHGPLTISITMYDC